MLKKAKTFFVFLAFLLVSFSLMAETTITIKCQGSEDECLKKYQEDKKEQESVRDAKVGRVPDHLRDSMQKRIEARSFNTFTIGPAGFAGLRSSDTAYALSVGHFWEASPIGGVKAVVQGQAGGKGGPFWLSGVIGGNLFLNDSDISPFITGDFGVGVAGSTHCPNVFGFVFGGGVGIQLFRTSSVHLELLGKYDQMLRKSGDAYPRRYSASLGILF